MPAPIRAIRTSSLRTASLPSFELVVHTTATDLLQATLPTLLRHERSANIILSHAYKIREEEAAGLFAHTQYPRLWISVWSMPTTALSPATPTSRFASSTSPAIGCRPQLEIVLSCCDWSLGTYPIFLWTAAQPSSLSADWLNTRMVALTRRLRELVPEQRVYSVFAANPVAKAFTKQWSLLTGAVVHPEPFYSASYSFCTLQTLVPERKGPLPAGHRLRRASQDDLMAVAQHCQLFAEESVYFPETDDAAVEEAQQLITKRALWVYEIIADDEDGVPVISIACVCAVTRTSANVAAITKVFTHPRFRQRGCAERLVRHVTKEQLTTLGKKMVVLYVGHTNSAARVYDRVGYEGLCDKPKVEGVEDWLELGFENSDRGHW
ncbi:hypothetical protein EXIGLDRAFT_695575 [Exidia glandulosa HHB12029]|uniref:N-acetyltransferase domain-containing protein n=1 Tax=Exidia glandulosa HHB12029 TaxID=1314781 RepID=A0A165NDT2_EXIGL|nr:hypothetical protein EXIGLDRAFT_695575 [Exidia glandulosa HHB12029]